MSDLPRPYAENHTMSIPTPIEISDVQLAFPADALDWMPAMEEIPEEFKDQHNPWVDFQHTWFRHGLSAHFAFVPATIDGELLDPERVLRHLQAIQGSFAPKHEHKEAAMAYLSSLWMESVIYGPRDCELEDMKTLGAHTLQDWIELLEE